MIRSSIALASALFLSTSAFAATTVVEFQSPEGESLTIEFTQGAEAGAGTTKVRGGENDGAEGTYTANSETGELCGSDASGVETCVTLDNPTGEAPQVGDTGTYSVTAGENQGATGTATVIEVTE